MTSGGALSIAEALALRQSLQGLSDSPDLDVALLLCHCLDKPRSYLYSWPERELTEAQQRQFQHCLQRRQEGEPIAHILGEREFWSLSLEVSADTLIPRPDTECLVEKALALLAGEESAARALDLGTGTGAIALALAAELPAWEVVGVDRVSSAVALARRNAKRNDLNNVQFFQSSWFDELDPKDKFVLIVSNPPYIDECDPHLLEGDVRFEPRSALVAQEAGLADLRSLIDNAPDYLSSGGWLLVEHGYNQAEAVAGLFAVRGYVNCGMGYDYGGNPRISWGCWK